LFNGGNITLKEVLGGALIGGAIGAVTGGITGGLNAQKDGLSFWKGTGVISEEVAIPIPVAVGTETSGNNIEYSNKSAKNFSNNYDQTKNLSKNVDNLFADGSVPKEFGYTIKGDQMFNKAGQEINGATTSQKTGWLGIFGKREINVYLAKSAFINKAQLYLTMNHEYMHSYFYFHGINVIDGGHNIIHDWANDQISAWGPINLQDGYLDAQVASPFNLYSKFGFNIMNNRP
jgi:hypothetical protein